VEALQDGKAITSCTLSFHRPEDGPYQHQDAMPACPSPEELASSVQRDAQLKRGVASLTESAREALKSHRGRSPLDVLPVVLHNPWGDDVAHAPWQMVWMRTRERLPEDPALHHAALLYMSDFNTLRVATMPHPGMIITLMTSLDHYVCFHGRPFRADEWLLFDLRSTTMVGCRAFVNGRVWSRDGGLVATLSQEGLIRGREPQAVAKL